MYWGIAVMGKRAGEIFLRHIFLATFGAYFSIQFESQIYETVNLSINTFELKVLINKLIFMTRFKFSHGMINLLGNEKRSKIAKNFDNLLKKVWKIEGFTDFFFNFLLLTIFLK